MSIQMTREDVTRKSVMEQSEEMFGVSGESYDDDQPPALMSEDDYLDCDLNLDRKLTAGEGLL